LGARGKRRGVSPGAAVLPLERTRARGVSQIGEILFPEILFSRIWFSAQDYAVQCLLLNPVVLLISTWQKSVRRKWFVLAVYQFWKGISAGPALKYFTWFIGAGGTNAVSRVLGWLVPCLFPTCADLSNIRPTQSIIYVPLQVSRFHRSIVLIVQYKYLKSCSRRFYSPESDLPHKIMRYLFYFSICSAGRFWATLLLRTTCMRVCCNGFASCVAA